MRRRAFWSALKFGTLPSRCYERESHYAPMGYWAHLILNLRYAARWLTWREEDADRAFERAVNGSH